MMYKIDDLALMTGLPIVTKYHSVKVHQPKLEQIALLGEEKFFTSLNMFYIKTDALREFIKNMDNISETDKETFLKITTEFDSLVFLLRAAAAFEEEKENEFGIHRLVENSFSLLFPDYKFHYNVENDLMLLVGKKGQNSIVVDRDLFFEVKTIVEQIFLLERFFGVEDKGLSEEAQKIADKIAISEKKIRKMNNEDQDDGGHFALMVSILGTQHDLNYLKTLTIYQLFNQFERFGLLNKHDSSVQAALAGASNIEFIDWYKKI